MSLQSIRFAEDESVHASCFKNYLMDIIERLLGVKIELGLLEWHSCFDMYRD